MTKQKSRLCDWLCEHGDAQDFQAFKGVLQMLAEVLKVDAARKLGSEQSCSWPSE